MNENLELNIKELYENKTILKSYPIKIYLEMTQRCNLKCIMCDQAIYSAEQKDFSADLFEKIKPLLHKASEVDFYLVGESTLSENLIRFLEDTKSYSFVPKIFTNGTILNEKILNAFDERGMFVNISIEAATPKIYESIRGASWERFERNVGRYVDRYQQRTNDRFHIRLSCTIAIDHISEILNITEFARRMGIRDVFMAAIDNWIVSNRHLTVDVKKAVYYLKKGRELADKYGIRYSCPTKIGDYIIENNNNWNDFNLPIDKYTNVYCESFNPNPFTKECGYPWIQTIIRANGDVLTCCQGRHLMGNLYKNSFDEIWNGTKYQTIRSQADFARCLGVGCNMINYSVWAHQMSKTTPPPEMSLCNKH